MKCTKCGSIHESDKCPQCNSQTKGQTFELVCDGDLENGQKCESPLTVTDQTCPLCTKPVCGTQQSDKSCSKCGIRLTNKNECTVCTTEEGNQERVEIEAQFENLQRFENKDNEETDSIQQSKSDDSDDEYKDALPPRTIGSPQESEDSDDSFKTACTYPSEPDDSEDSHSIESDQTISLDHKEVHYAHGGFTNPNAFETNVDEIPKKNDNTETRVLSEHGKNAAQPREKERKRNRIPTPQQNVVKRVRTDRITVVFHVLLSSNFLGPEEDQNTASIFLQIGGQGKDCNEQMQFKRYVDKKYAEFEFRKELLRTRLTKGIKYHYSVSKKGESKPIIEDYYINSTKLERLIEHFAEMSEMALWHQYDGVATVDSPAKFFKGKNAGKRKETKVEKLRNHAYIFATEFCPSWFKRSCSDQEITETIQESCEKMICLICGLRAVYRRDNNVWNTDELFLGEICSKLFEPAVQSLRKEAQTREELYDQQITAIAIIDTCNNVSADLSFEERKLVCQSLLPDISSDDLMTDMAPLFQILHDRNEYLLNHLKIYIWRFHKFKKDPSWMYLLPLLHIADNCCAPNEEPQTNFCHTDPNAIWWGTSRISLTVSMFKQAKEDWLIPVEKVVSNLKPFFKMDYFLSRSFLACLNPLELQTVIKEECLSLESCCASLYFWTHKIDHAGSFLQDRSALQKAIWNMRKRLERMSNTTDVVLPSLEMAYTIAMEGVYTADIQHDIECFVNWVHMFLMLISYASKCSDRTMTTFLPIPNMNTIKVRVLSCVRNMLIQPKSIPGFLKIVDRFICQIPLHGDLREVWNNEMETVISQQIPLVYGYEEVLLNVFCTELESFSPTLQTTLTEITCKVVLDGLFDINAFNKTQLKRVNTTLEKHFLEQWNERVGNEDSGRQLKILQHVLGWPPMILFYRSLENGLSYLITDSENEHRLSESISVIKASWDGLVIRHVKLNTLHMMCLKRNAFAEIVSHVCEIDRSTVDETMNLRSKELQVLNKQRGQLIEFVQHCEQFKDAVASTNQVIEQYNDVSILDEVCTPITMEHGTIQEEDAKFIGANPNLLAVLPQMTKLFKSRIFETLWFSACERVSPEVKCIDDILELIWKPISERYFQMVESISSGNMDFEEFEQYVQPLRNDIRIMRDELVTCGIPETTVTERVEQFLEKTHLDTCHKGANIVIQLKIINKLQGDFTPLEVLVADYTKVKMKEWRKPQITDFLDQIDTHKTDCLDAYVECKQAVEWIHKSMGSGGKDLNVFVDLAMMSAGEEPINITKVQCLHLAATGYAPLLFHLQPDFGYLEILEKCEEVWTNLDKNPDLPKQLRDTGHELLWLEDIHKTHGAVATKSLKQAEDINEGGKYVLEADGLQGYFHQLTVEKVLKLTVYKSEDANKLKTYSYSEVKDLQSRLMLVMGKSDAGNIDVDKFVDILNSLVRLGNVFIKLCSAGCVLFNDLTATFRCKEKNKVCLTMRFGRKKDLPMLRGRKSDEENLDKMIPAVADFMENCLAQWYSYIKETRKKYFHLNFFTIDQLVILQKQLVQLSSSETPLLTIYDLLSNVKSNCCLADIVKAMDLAKKDIQTMEKVKERRMGKTGETTEEDEIDSQRREEFVEKLLAACLSEDIARRYVDEQVDITTCTVDEAVFWCMENQNEEAEITPLAEEITFSKWCTGEKSLSSVWNANIHNYDSSRNTDGVAALISALKELWECFLSSITDSTGTSDYLNLEHLGIILKHLAARDEVDVKREVPANSMENEPNVILCKSDETLTTTLSIYMNSMEQPLPSADEVLLCTQKTHTEEVEIFIRRSMYEQKEKLHCLVNADLLDFDVSEAAGHYLEECIQEKNYKKEKAYRLFIICRRENENRSPLVSSLQKYIRADIPIDEVHLAQYILSKFSLKNATDQTFASNVDVEKSNARAVLSQRAGVGKSLFVKRVEEKLQTQVKTTRQVEFKRVTIPLQEKILNLDYVTRSLIEHAVGPDIKTAQLFHIDISHEVQEGIDELLFNLLILNCLKEESGLVWRRSESDIYLIEHMPRQASPAKNSELQYTEVMFRILPNVTCRSPNECLSEYKTDSEMKTVQLFDEKEFRSDVFQRPFQYLKQLDDTLRKEINPKTPVGTRQECLEILLRHCGIPNPSWAELHHFVWFLNTQLIGFENNEFVSAAAAEDLPGFGKFVLKFLIQMSKDFSNRSLNIGDESSTDDQGLALETYELRRKWESSPHPYLFFNSDGISFTFLGFNIDSVNGNLIDQQTGAILEKHIMKQDLYTALVRNQVDLREDFDALSRERKIEKLINVMGGKRKTDPDPTYELTTDNVKKILAIYMRFKCDIPVIVMGETGCGKTRLIKFMCSLQVPDDVELQNTVVMKVHGGTTHADIERKVNEADRLARENAIQDKSIHTVLFFDEGNTTESIGLLKEIMCDNSLRGKRLDLSPNLKIVAACNPYRRHSDKMIEKLEQAGLGYHVKAGKTADTFGQIPLRRLVYRVHPLPQSLRPLVWDFGQLTTKIEELYINQMVKRYIKDEQLPPEFNLTRVLSKILTESQLFMREQDDECSFVSLRDVERVLFVMSWFYSKGSEYLFPLMNDQIGIPTEDLVRAHENPVPSSLTRSLILALGVCYHACLKSREKYRETVQRYFKAPFNLREKDGAEQILQEIECCQNVVLNNVSLTKNIARNTALKENVFMMVICIELRIPLFLVGKPGSSKSLAKTIVAEAMQGNSARHNLFKHLKQTQMVSFQCSPLATPDGIVATFRQCSQFQKSRNLSAFVSTVVLDEVGLAEDSPRMPLKTLHPLLEDGCQGDEISEDYMKVAFIGLSNWALDPAKMNRGIFVQRDVPDEKELNETARGICASTNKTLQRIIDPLIEPLAKSYLQVFNDATNVLREFYGLRDFYSLIKMLFAFIERSQKQPTRNELEHCIKRNFGGLPQVDAVKCFKGNLLDKMETNETQHETAPDCSHMGLIDACIFGSFVTHGESRYPLLLADNLGAVSLMQQHILSNKRVSRPIIIFGSSFRGDQEYTQICRNINKIKVCMETGNTVVLLNLESLYVSLYDALNQYYVYFGGQRFVDLGLGTHRVKCQVHKEFRLIVVAEKDTVYNKFPIPLINRLEKHFLTSDGMLDLEQTKLAEELKNWATFYVEARFSAVQFRKSSGNGDSKIEDGFISYNEDTCSGIILQMFLANKGATTEEILDKAKLVMLACATPECVVRNEETEEHLAKHYFDSKQHDSLVGFLGAKINTGQKILAQITTHSKLLSGIHHKEAISDATGIQLENILFIEALTSLETEQQFSSRIQQHLFKQGDDPSLILIQCAAGDENANLIDCARFGVLGEMEKMHERLHKKGNIHCVIVVQLPRKAGGCFNGFQSGTWESVHIDDLHSEDIEMPQLHEMRGISVSRILTASTLPTTRREELTNVREEINIENRNNTSSGQEEHRGGTAVKNENSILEKNQHHLLETSNIKDGLETVSPEMEKYGVGRDLLETCTRVPRIRVKGIVVQCVQSAAALVKDISECSRGTKRVKILLKNINKSSGFDQNDFLHGIQMILAKLLTEKEHLVESKEMAKAWMAKEAAATSTINKAGTFRNSCHQVMCTKVTPVFAGLIAYLDTDNNLDMIELKDSWRTQLWRKFINTPGAIDIKFDDIRSTQEDGQIAVGSSGYEGHFFSAKFPFSWVISRYIDAMRHNVHFKNLSGGTENKDKIVTECKTLTSESGVGKALLGIQLDDRNYQDIVGSYVEDYLHTLYNSDNDIEFKLVLEVVRQETMRNIDETKSKSDIVGSLICAHIAVQELSLSLADFRLVNSIWPDCSPALQKIRKEKPDTFLASKEEGIVFPSICLMIESLTPKPGEQEEINSRKQWLERVNIVRPVIEKVLNSKEAGAEMSGKRIVIHAKHTWNRVMVMKLFIENICIPLDGFTDSTITWKRCGQLWTVMADNMDCTALPSFVKVEKFLTLCNKKAFQFFYGTDLKKCTECGEEVKTPPVFLPCSKNHIVCEKCYEEIRTEKRNRCNTCNHVFPVDWEPTDIEQKRDEKKKLVNYQEKCNSFLLAVISQLCFSENKTPCQEIIEKLFGYITCSKTEGRAHFTKEMTMFNTGIDRSPVFRSYLIQLLVRCSEGAVTTHLQQYFEKAVKCIEDNEYSPADISELCLLFIQCIEDSLMQKAYMDKTKCEYAAEILNSARTGISSDTLNVDKIYSIAKARTGLRIVADFMNRIVQNETSPSVVPSSETHMFSTAKYLCSEQLSKHARQFLVKNLCRTYGLDRYMAICGSKAKFLKWIRIHKEKQMISVDRFVVCGKQYKEIRKCILSFLHGERCLEEIWRDVMKITSQPRMRDLLVQLSIYREVTIVDVDVEGPAQERIQQLTAFIENDKTSEAKESSVRLLKNEMQPQIICRKAEDTVRTKDVKCLLIHFLQSLENVQWAGTFMYTFVLLLKAESNIQEMFLPTMPQDDREYVKQAMEALHLEPSTWYRCPNDHPYAIGDCGMPGSVSTCSECGENIGGEWHIALPGNVVDDLEDQTQPGHLLGPGENRGPPVPERKLTVMQVAITRIFLHMALLGGAGRNTAVVCRIIKPKIEPETVNGFLWKHIQKDIDDLQQSTKLSFDDTLLLMHSLISSMVNKTSIECAAFGPDQALLTNKNDRQEWEVLFTRVALDDTLKNINKILGDLNKELAADDPFHCIVHDIDRTKGTDDPTKIAETSRTWRYRTPVSTEHLQQELEKKRISDKSSLRILSIFLQEDHALQAIRFVPNIMKLHRILLQKYQMKLDKSAAKRCTVRNMKSDKVAGTDTETLLKDFSDAWEITRHYLQKHVCNTEDQRRVVQKELCMKPITDDTPLSFFLPATNGQGLCSYALLDFLLRKQNSFLDKCGLKKRKSVKPTGLTTAHLISYDHENDIIPLIIANCQSTFVIGQENRIEYDFEGLQRQLVDQYLISKSNVDIKSYLKIDTMKYVTEVTRADAFKSLEEKIQQFELDEDSKHSIIQELQDLPDLCNSIDQLVVTINFLRTLGGDPDMFLNHFMTQTLLLEKTALCSQKARQVCTLGHVRSLWLLFSLRKSMLMVDRHFQHDVVFEHIDDKFHQKIPENVKTEFEVYVQGLPEETHAKFVSFLHECLLLQIATSDVGRRDDPDFVDTSGTSLRDTLMWYKDENPDVSLEVLTNIPNGLLKVHTVDAWITAYIEHSQQMFITRRRVQRF